MLTLIFLLILQTVIATGICHWLFRILATDHTPAFETKLLIGLGLIGVLCHGISIFVAIDWKIQTLVALFGLSALIDNSYLQTYKTYWARVKHTELPIRCLFFLLIGTAILLASGPIIRDDTESYHLQNILWIREYGTVPGLANLHTRFGFNSVWFHTIAALVPSTENNFYTTPNTLLSILLMSHLLITPSNDEMKGKSRREKITPYILTGLSVFACWYYWRGNIQSTNYDYYFTSAMAIVLIPQYKNGINNPTTKQWGLLLPPILFCIRPLYAPVLLITLWLLYTLLQKNNYKAFALYSLFSILIIFSFLYRNYILSGHPLYPSELLSFWHPKWMVPEQRVEELYLYINEFIKPGNTQFLESIRTWLGNLYSYDLAFMIIGMIGWVISITKLKNAGTFSIIIRLYVVTQLTIWYIVSPEPRFIAGLFLVGQFYLYKAVSDNVNFSTQIKYSTIALFICVNVLVLYKKINSENKEYRSWVLPTPIPKPEIHTFTWEGNRVNIPKKFENNWNARCYLTPLPCVYDSLYGIKMIGNNIQNGFYVDRYEKRNIP